jgi:hypothetical protein
MNFLKIIDQMKKQSFIEYKQMEDKFIKINHFKMFHNLIQTDKLLENRVRYILGLIESYQVDLVFHELLEILKRK